MVRLGIGLVNNHQSQNASEENGPIRNDCGWGEMTFARVRGAVATGNVYLQSSKNGFVIIAE